MERSRLTTDLAVPLIAVATLPVGILATLFASFEVGVAVFVVGWFLLTPVLAILGEEVEWGGGEEQEETDPIDRLRDRYATGEIDEAEFERRLDALVETEDLEADDGEAIGRAVDRIDAGGTTAEREPE